MARELARGDVMMNGGAVRIDWSIAALSPGVVLGRGAQAALGASRKDRLLKDDDADLSIFFARRGCAYVSQNGRRSVLRPGEAIFVAHARPVASWWPDTEFDVLKIARDDLPGATRIEMAGGQVLERSSPALRLLQAYTGALWPMLGAEPPPALAQRHLIELAGLALTEATTGPRAGPPDAGVQAARLAAMLEVIARRFHEAGLTMKTVAHAVGVSERAGYLIFERAQLGFSETLFDHRLTRAAELLRGGYKGAILELALDVGFSDLSHFNRRFRRKFGCPPGEMRAVARGAERA